MNELMQAAIDKNLYEFKKAMEKAMKRLTMKEESKYQKFFKKKLDKWKIKSPAELTDEEKKKFFSEIETEWKEDE
jgi:hypothetical protein